MDRAPQTPTPATDRVAHIFQLNRETVRIRPKTGYDVTIMVGREVEAYVSALDGSETVIAKLQSPGPEELISVFRFDEGHHVDVVYKKVR
jgi:hypothetical protein